MGAPGEEGRRGPRGPGLLPPLPARSSAEYLPDARLQGHLRPLAPARARCAEPGPSAGRLRAATKVPKGASAAQTAGADRGRSSLLLGGRRKNCWQPGQSRRCVSPPPYPESAGLRRGRFYSRLLSRRQTFPGLWSSWHRVCRWGWKAKRCSSQGVPGAARGRGARACGALLGILTPVSGAPRPASPRLPSLSPPGDRNGDAGGTALESGSEGQVSSESKSRP